MDKIKKTMGILLAVLFVVSLTASAGLASCSAGNSCDNGACGSACDSCGSACDNGAFGSACDSCGSACDHGCCCKAKGPTWEDWFNAFKNDGFDTWAGFNFGSFGNMFNF
jgi:hypothetical protein